MAQDNVGHGAVEPFVEEFLAGLDLVGGVVGIVLGVQVPGDDVVAQLRDEVQAARVARAGAAGRAQVGREEAEDVAQGHLVVDDLRVAAVVAGGREVFVGPGVRGDLVALGVDAPEDGGPLRRLIVDAALANVVARHEEGCAGVVLAQEVQEGVGVEVRAVVEGERDGIVLGAGLDVLACGGSEVCLSTRSKLLTIRGLPVVVSRRVLGALPTGTLAVPN